MVAYWGVVHALYLLHASIFETPPYLQGEVAEIMKILVARVFRLFFSTLYKEHNESIYFIFLNGGKRLFEFVLDLQAVVLLGVSWNSSAVSFSDQVFLLHK